MSSVKAITLLKYFLGRLSIKNIKRVGEKLIRDFGNWPAIIMVEGIEITLDTYYYLRTKR